MNDEIAKNSIRTLLNEAVAMAVGQQLPITELRGIALFDQRRDARLTDLASYAPAAPAILTIPNFETRYGGEEVNRILLQLIYEYFKRIEDIRFDEAVFDVLWRDFSAELKETHWAYRGVANLRHFRKENSPLEVLNLRDGITAQGRNQAALTPSGF